MSEYWFYICLPLVAFLYAAVGHGGASGYLALLSLFSFAAHDVKTIALTLNLFVAGIAFFHYSRAGHFDKKLFLVLACSSMPMAFLGGRLQLETNTYFHILAVFLALAGLRLLLFSKNNDHKKSKEFSMGVALLIGGGLGFASGVLGIGGGILLSPLLLFLAWCNAKTTAGVSALFIFVNSGAALIGMYSKGLTYPSPMPYIILLVIVAGFIGAYFGANRWSNQYIKRLLAAVLLLASLKIFLT
jgi:uncharacterized membrane protein YfcA